ncbi:hypothetical protein GF362_00890 [Candidatus Dojkabacteria bacterium]|nr:hypothetical protein [Candidatus Dojkabacteria bacterium]
MKNKNKLPIILLLVIVIIPAISLIAYLAFQNSNRKNQTNSNDLDNAVSPTDYIDQSTAIPTVDDSLDTSEKGTPYKLITPFSNDSVSCPFEVKGEIPGYWFFEASFPVGINDQQGNELMRVSAHTDEEWMTDEFVDFEATIDCTFKTKQKVVMTLYKSNVSDKRELDDKIEIPLTIVPQENSIIEVFFYNTKNDPNMLDCSKVYPVKREIKKTEAMGKAAINELLKGPEQDEVDDGYSTSIPEGVVLQSLRIENDIAYADFNEKLDYQVGGSCRVESIRSQISQTLKQFPTVNQVIISINNESNDILQP